MRFLQKLGKALMLPVAVLPICGLLMGIGYFLCPASIQGGEIHGFFNLLGLYLVKAGSAAIDNIAWLFVVGVGVGMSDDNDGTGAVAALLSWLMIITLLSTDFVVRMAPSVSENISGKLAFDKIANPFIGILAGLIGSECYNRFKKVRLPSWLSFFSGKRCVAIIAAVVSIAAALILLFVWPVLYGGLVKLGGGIAGMGYFGAGIYVFLNRLLIPLGLHHALNNVFWFDTVGLGDLTHFWAGDTSADVKWSLGMYMSGFFPCMMFGIPGAALAMIHCSKPEKKKAALGILASAAICSFVCGVTEPFEFAFMFAAPVLYVIYSALYGIFAYIACVVGFRAGFSFSGGVTDLIFSSSLPASAKTWMIIPLGLAAFAVFYGVFRFAIVKWNLMTPGREEDKGASAEAEEASARAALKSSDAGEPSVLDTVYAPQAGRPTISDASDSSEAGGTSVRGAVYAARSGRDAAGAAADSSGAGETSVRSSVYAPRSGRPTVSDLAESPHSGRSFVQDSAGSSPLDASSVRNTNGPQAGKAYLWDTANGPHAGRGANRDAANRPQTGRSSVRETGVPQGGPPSVWNSVELHPAKAEVVVEDQFMDMASGILEGIGGIDNLISLDNCITRLRMEVKNSALVNEARIKDAGARAVLRTGRNSVQVVIGTEVQFVADAFREIFRVDK